MTISVGGGVTFDVPRDAYDQAVALATEQHRTMFVGMHDNGVSEISDDRDLLLTNGCFAIAWVTPNCGGL